MRRVRVVLSVVNNHADRHFWRLRRSPSRSPRNQPRPRRTGREGVTFVPARLRRRRDRAQPDHRTACGTTLDPGAGSQFLEDDPTSGLLFVESGTFTVRI